MYLALLLQLYLLSPGGLPAERHGSGLLVLSSCNYQFNRMDWKATYGTH